PEAGPEVGEAPPDLGHLVPAGGERHDHVVVRLGDRVAVAAARGDAQAVRLHDPGIDVGALGGQPREEGSPHVEGYPLEVVGDVGYSVPGVDPAGGRVGRVALGRDPRVPVVVGVRRILDLDDLEPGIL